MADARILFAGGGSERDTRPLDEMFSGWLGGGRLLYLPTALVNAASMRAGLRWIQSALAPLGVTDIQAWMDLSGKTLGDLAAYDGVFIGGGNTFYLLQEVRKAGLDAALTQYVQEGGPVYGGSAGAIILGRDITSCAHIDTNNVGLTDFTGLDLALGHTVWCHYAPEHDPLIEAYVGSTGIPSVAVTDRSGAARQGDHLYAAGYEPALRFTPLGRERFKPGERIV